MRHIIFMQMLVMLILAMMFCFPVPASTVISNFECHGKNSTMTSYSYLEEPKLQESSFASGMKTGSFHYLVDGSFDYSDEYKYYDGRVDADHLPDDPNVNYNSSVNHTISLNFVGDKGISEFYSRGHFPDNRAISAMKKIWYVDFYNKTTSKGYNLGYYPSDKIKVRGKVGMGPAQETGMETDYYFEYNAKANNTIMDIFDATGWSNKTGSRRIDWEQSAQMKGKFIDVTNNLRVSGLYLPGAGGDEEWLPCCFDSLAPPPHISSKDQGDWPSASAQAVVSFPSKILPKNTCLSRSCSSSTPCTADSCANFTCINTYGANALSGSREGGATSKPAIPESVSGLGPSISVDSVFEMPTETDKKVTYQILVTNTGNTLLTGVTLVDTLPAELVFNSTDTELAIPPDGNMLYWDLGSIAAGTREKVTLVADMLNNATPTEEILKKNTVYAAGNSGDKTVDSGNDRQSRKITRQEE
jgi:uncharacterized repeat protein (TIGR01451 family)